MNSCVSGFMRPWQWCVVLKLEFVTYPATANCYRRKLRSCCWASRGREGGAVAWTKKDSVVDSCGQEDGLLVPKEAVDWLVEQSSASHAVLCSSLCHRAAVSVCVAHVNRWCCWLTACSAVATVDRHWHYLNYIYTASPYRAVNTLRLGYTNQSVNAV
jgi:hypothetical protein